MNVYNYYFAYLLFLSGMMWFVVFVKVTERICSNKASGMVEVLRYLVG